MKLSAELNSYEKRNVLGKLNIRGRFEGKRKTFHSRDKTSAVNEQKRTTPATVEAMIAKLNGRDFGAVLTTIYSVGELGKRAEAAVPTLIKISHGDYKCDRKNPDGTEYAELHLAASNSIEKILTSVGESAVPLLIKLLKDSDLQITSLEVLSNLGKKAAPAVPTLVRLFKDRNALVKTMYLNPDSNAAGDAEASQFVSESGPIISDREIRELKEADALEKSAAEWELASTRRSILSTLMKIDPECAESLKKLELA